MNSKLVRVLCFVMFGIPGAVGVTWGGIILGFALAGPSGTGTIESISATSWLFIGASPFLTLLGTGSVHQPLYLVFLYCFVTVLSTGSFLAEYRHLAIGVPFTCFGLWACYELLRWVRRHYGTTNAADPDLHGLDCL